MAVLLFKRGTESGVWSLRGYADIKYGSRASIGRSVSGEVVRGEEDAVSWYDHER